LDLPAKATEKLLGLLSAPERERAARFRLKLHGDRFVAGRGILRLVLARYLSADPGALEFSYTWNGKPQLAGAFARSGLQFNLAHSENVALLAATTAEAVGVDVERVRQLADMDELVARFFSPSERSAFHRLAPAQRLGAFFNWWTRKEAWLKAIGVGISQGLERVKTTFLPDEPVRLLSVPETGSGVRPWSLRELAPAPGFVAAVAVAAKDVRLSCWAWPVAKFAG
jgi:4'-phosphopantetheinyl transferase